MRITCALVVTLVLAAGATLADDRIDLKGDSRLLVKASLSLSCEPLSAFAEVLSEATGAVIRVRKDIADKNVTVFADDIPAHEAMVRIAQVLDYGWEVKGDQPDERVYTLFRSLKKKREGENLLQEYWKAEDRAFRDVIEDGIRMADGDTEVWQKEFEKNPAQTLRNHMFRDTLRDLGCFTKEQRDGIWAQIMTSPQAEIRIPFAELPPGLQKRFKERIDRLHAEHPDRFRSSEEIETQSLIISRGGGGGSPRISGLPLQSRLAFFGLSGYGGSAGMGTARKDSRVWEDDLKRLQDDGIDTSSYKLPSPEHADPESLSERVKLEFEKKDDSRLPGLRSFPDILEAASRMFEVSIFADDYLCRHRNNASTRTTLPEDLDEALVEIGREFGYEVIREGKCLRLTCETWYMEEPYEVPKRLVTHWADIKKEQGRLELKDYLDIVRKLDNLQITGLQRATIKGARPLLWEVMRMGSHLDRLRLYSMLNPGQAKQASEVGLPLVSMNMHQRELFKWLLQDAKPDLPDEALAGCAFRVREDSRIRQGDRGDQGQPYRSSEDLLIFTYIFAPGDERQHEMVLERRSLASETPAAQ